MSPFKFNDHQDSEQTSKDYLTAQLIERQELESLKYNEWPKTDENSSQSTKQYQQKSKYRSNRSNDRSIKHIYSFIFHNKKEHMTRL